MVHFSLFSRCATLYGVDKCLFMASSFLSASKGAPENLTLIFSTLGSSDICLSRSLSKSLERSLRTVSLVFLFATSAVGTEDGGGGRSWGKTLRPVLLRVKDEEGRQGDDSTKGRRPPQMSLRDDIILKLSHNNTDRAQKQIRI